MSKEVEKTVEPQVEQESPGFMMEAKNYRIKSEPKYRPFKTKEECWDEMHKHPDFGWVIYDDSISAVQNIAPDGIETSNFYFEECFVNMKFVDGTPFGIKDE